MDTNLYIFDLLTETLDTILDPNDKVCPYSDAYHLEQINGENSFRFKVPANNYKAGLVREGNLVAFKDLDGDFQLFEIKLIEEIHEDIILKDVYCEHAILELLDEFIAFKWDRNETATTILTDALSGTRWSVGTVTVPGTATVRMELNNPIEVFRKMITAFNAGEFKYRITVSGNSITGRFVDFLANRGTNTGKRFEYGKDINSIKREIDFTNVKTALYGFGKAQEVPGGIRRVKFDNVVWTTPPNPKPKPLGQTYLEDSNAKAQWGRNGGSRNKFGYYENPDQEDPGQLLIETNALLDQLKNPIISYEMKVTDLERVSGYSHEKVRLGDIVTVIDRTFNPELYIEQEVIELRRYITEPEKDEIVLDKFRPSIIDDGLILRDLQERVHDNQGVWQDSAYKNNMITDHSFENIPRLFSGTSPDADQVYEANKTNLDYGSIFWWQWVGTGYIISSYNETTLKDYNQLALFDYQAAVISTVTGKISKVFQYVPLNKMVGLNGPYTASCYVSTFTQTTIDGNAIMYIYACQKNTTRLNGGLPVGTASMYLLVTEKDNWKRNIVTISEQLPVGTELLEIYITSDTAEFKYLCDGVQLVPMDKPMTYEPESNLWKMMRRFPGTKLNYPIFLGDVDITGMVIQESPDACRAYQSVLQSLSAGVWTKVTFTNEDYDPRSSYSTVNSRFTITTAGYYLVIASVRLEFPASSSTQNLAIYKNGTIIEKIDIQLGAVQLSASSIVKLAASDYIEIYVWSSVGVDTRPGTEETHLEIFRLG